ncbi:MAG: tRNA (adenosine(37)-N6)-dimethylallyltransferase MiaA [Eubacterium sp.]|nr:tRNA (adenosine(37)-N6)-dimethylallyltransferase MiaA [Eubacterium sp.]
MEKTVNNIKPKLIIITGPTAAGKTALSLELAKRLDGEIISADSMQVYKRMDIGTAKIMKEEMQGIRHHLIDILEPSMDFNVSLFKKLSKEAAEDIYSRGKMPIVVGGTGFYIQALLYDISFEPEEDDGYKETLQELSLTEGGPEKLYNMLKEVDPESAEIIHINNAKRVIRALDFYHKNGSKISAHNALEKSKDSPYDFRYFVLTDNREVLYKRIDERVDKMIAAGLFEEVRSLLEEGLTENNISMQGIGYKEVIDYLRGRSSADECIYNIKINTRHFAKRQLTWFRHEKDVIYIDKSLYKNEEEILEYMLNTIE